ncbi:MAG TPA: cellulase family glycosylhydrolase, partial [Polyangia bacterium]
PDGDAHTPKQYLPGTDYYETLLRPTVDYLKQKGLYAIIDWHYIADTTAHQSTTSAFWTEMAPKFANDSNVLFELYNEPINGGNWQTVKPDMQVWHDIVRQGAPRNLILVGSGNWDQLVAAATSDPIQGHDLVFVAHMYPEHWKQVSLRQQIATAAKRFPIAITEWGFDSSSGTLNGSIDDYGTSFREFVRELNISWTAWCASTSWRPTMFNRDFTLRTGDRAMGGFVKDWLYEDKDKNQPF